MRTRTLASSSSAHQTAGAYGGRGRSMRLRARSGHPKRLCLQRAVAEPRRMGLTAFPRCPARSPPFRPRGGAVRPSGPGGGRRPRAGGGRPSRRAGGRPGSWPRGRGHAAAARSGATRSSRASARSAAGSSTPVYGSSPKPSSPSWAARQRARCSTSSRTAGFGAVLVDLAQGRGDQRAGQFGLEDGGVDVRGHVGRPDFQRRPVPGRAEVPIDHLDVQGRPGAEQGLYRPAEVGRGREVRRQPRRGPAGPGHRPPAGVARVTPAPERRVGRQGDQCRQPRSDPVGHRHGGVHVERADVDVAAAADQRVGERAEAAVLLALARLVVGQVQRTLHGDHRRGRGQQLYSRGRGPPGRGCAAGRRARRAAKLPSGLSEWTAPPGSGCPRGAARPAAHAAVARTSGAAGTTRNVRASTSRNSSSTPTVRGTVGRTVFCVVPVLVVLLPGSITTPPWTYESFHHELNTRRGAHVDSVKCQVIVAGYRQEAIRGGTAGPDGATVAGV